MKNWIKQVLFSHLTTPEYGFQEWIDVLEQEILDKSKTHTPICVAISGASASGKGEAVEQLKTKLLSRKLSVITISTDDYYKGIDRMKSEGLEIDFDTPSAVDLLQLSLDIANLKKGALVSIPVYSFQTSQRSGSREVNGGDCDVILIEGIFALTPLISKEAHFTSFVDADYKTLFMRRFRRDVLAKRSSRHPEEDLWMLLEVVLPAYTKHILPQRERAQIILKNDYTGTETFDTELYDVQDKLALDEGEVVALRKQLNEPLSVTIQDDYYFTVSDEVRNSKHLLRIRVENGVLKNLVHKGTVLIREDGKVVRPTEIYIHTGEFGKWFATIDELKKSFLNAGFVLSARITKEREQYEYNGVHIAIDYVSDLGRFIELSTNNSLSRSSEIDELKKQFNLENKKSSGPYYDEFFLSHHNKNESQNKLGNHAIYTALLERDLKDIEITKQNREVLSSFGLQKQTPQRTLRVDTTITKNAEEVARSLFMQIKESETIISIDGLSGVGKTTTTKLLSDLLNAVTLSMGEVFRYVTFRTQQNSLENATNVVARLSYTANTEGVYLMDGALNVTKDFATELRDKRLEEKLPIVAKQIQSQVIHLLQKSLPQLKTQYKGKIILEGRAFTLDFLPSDLRITLVADPLVRAQRCKDR